MWIIRIIMLRQGREIKENGMVMRDRQRCKALHKQELTKNRPKSKIKILKPTYPRRIVTNTDLMKAFKNR
jgi:hypothetical protein